MKLKVLIVDDERPARTKVRRFVTADPDIGQIFEAPDGVRAVDVIREESPDLVFLDVQMPGLDGFGVVEALPPDALPHVVFVTAFDDYAVRAFDVHAVDYVMKPFDVERLARALERAKAAITSRRNNGEAARVDRLLADIRRERPERLERLLVQGAERSLLLPLTRVDRLESARNYVVLHAGRESFRVRSTLDRLEQRLDPKRFVRVSRTAIVNVDRVAELKPWSHGDWVVVLSDGAKLRLSRTFRDRLERFGP
ncbi:MAG TPA: LytTR family DNA-binding domain-containing protein [Gemmatimonadales bacterium]|nr:LytTR family DNA-binding domain-containing protein [Gemmatimonadales bacterium]